MDTPFYGGIFQVSINVPTAYPMEPPKVKFVTKIFHPNIHFKVITEMEWSTPTYLRRAKFEPVFTSLAILFTTTGWRCLSGYFENRVESSLDITISL